MSKQTVYGALVAIAEKGKKNGKLVSYADDLHVIDKQELDASFPGDEFIWVLKDCGTYCARIGGTKFARETTAYGMQTNANDIYHIVITELGGFGSVKHINLDKAAKMLSTVPGYQLRHLFDLRYVVVDTKKENSVVADCTIERPHGGTGLIIDAVISGTENKRSRREVEEAISDGIVSMTGSIFARIEKLEIRFSDQVDDSTYRNFQLAS